MKAGGAALFPLLIAAILAGLTFWLDQTTRVDGAAPAETRQAPDAWVETFSIRRFGADGSLKHTLVADRLLHYPHDDSALVTAPRLTYTADQTTTLDARTAWLDKEGENVRLNDDVRIVRAATADSPETVLTTTLLYVVPDDEYAHTPAPVTITQGQSVINGVGLEANGKTGVTVLNGPVTGIIQRQPKS